MTPSTPFSLSFLILSVLLLSSPQQNTMRPRAFACAIRVKSFNSRSENGISPYNIEERKFGLFSFKDPKCLCNAKKAALEFQSVENVDTKAQTVLLTNSFSEQQWKEDIGMVHVRGSRYGS